MLCKDDTVHRNPNRRHSVDCKTDILILFLLLTCLFCHAQKPFAEGTVVYKVTLESADHKTFKGTYTFIIKGNQVRKEIKLNNGYQDIVLLNCGANKVYSLQNRSGKKYAIELSMPDMLKSQDKFRGFTIKNEMNNNKKLAGQTIYKANISYTNGTAPEIYYTKDWYPAQPVTFERFPDAKFFPMYFSYTDEQGMAMEFEIEKIEPGPIENAEFRIPAEYKMISYDEYKQFSQ
jgi:hypothetical protein